MIDILQLVIYGIVLGGILTLGAIGLSLIFGILGFAHFAHGDMMTLGAYFALAFVAGLGLPFYVAVPLAMAAASAAAIAIDRAVYRRLRRTAPVILLISSVGIALILRSVVQLIWGPDNQVYHPGITLPIELFGTGLRIKADQLYILAGVGGLVTGLHFFLQKTKIGKAMRAMADNIDLAQVTGIETERVVLWAWVIGASLAAAAGVFLGIDTRLNPNMGWFLLLPIFAAAILGGIGRPYGAIVGGMTIGIAQEVSTAFMAPAYKPAIAFALMVAMLVVRPTGLFAGRSL